MKFQVGRFSCEIMLDEDGKLKILWSPEQPKYLNKREREQYQVNVAAFLDGLGDNIHSRRAVGDDQKAHNLARLNGSG
jgi:hypothetical protein